MENCCFNTLPRHNSQHELIENSLVIIQSIWNNDSITINLFPKNSSHGYTGTIETTTLSLTADSLEIDFSEFMAETKSALSSENGLANFTYCLEQSSEHTSFKWCKVTEGGFRIEYGNVALRVQDNLKEEMIIDALSINKTKEQKIEEQKQEIQLMNVDYKRMEDVLEKCIEEKNNLEEKLLTKFAALLNAKKEKIVELQHALANRTGDEEDYESDGSDDDSDIEYSSQRYVADVPTPGPSTSHQDDNTVIFPKRMKPNPENKVVQQVQQVQQVQRSNSTDSTDIYDRETQVLIDDM